MSNIFDLSLIETIKSLKEKNFSEEELNRAYFNRISKFNPKLNIFLSASENKSGIPAGIKDLISVKGMRTSAGSKIIEHYKSPSARKVILP